MKKLTPLALVALFSLNVFAQVTNDNIDQARAAERQARDNAYGIGYLTPGNPPEQQNPYQPQRPPMKPPMRPPGNGGYYPPPMPPPPPPGQNYPPPMPQYGYDFGPNYTVRWEDRGSTKLPKILSQSVVIDVRGQLVNEILLRSVDNEAQIQSLQVYLMNGQIIDLRQLTGIIRKGAEFRSVLDYRFSLRVDRIVIQGTSSNLFGSRGAVQVLLGLSQ